MTTIKSRLAKLEALIRPVGNTPAWVVLRADGSAYLRMQSGQRIETDPDNLPRVKGYTKDFDPDLWDGEVME
jgi:hypothetical protein